MKRLLARLGRELAYLLPLGPIAILALSLLPALALVSAATVIVWIGIPLGVGTLWLARGFASLERARLRALTGTPAPAAYVPRGADRGLRAFLSPVRDPQYWRDLAHGVFTSPLAIVSWVVAFTWSVLAVGGTTAVIWMRWLPPDDSTETGFLGWLGSVQGVTVVGVIALASLPWVARVLAALHRLLGQWLLGVRSGSSARIRVAQLEQARLAAAEAEATSLRRIERDLHDGPQQHLVRLGMELDRAERLLEAEPAAAREALATARELTAEALAELRALSRGIAPPLLAERGLATAVASLADRMPIPVGVDARVPDHLGLGPQTAAYFVVAESLANVAKHAHASRASVSLDVSDGVLTVRVEDDGQGGAQLAKGHGLVGLHDRVLGAGGSLSVTDAAEGGTVVIAEVPCA